MAAQTSKKYSGTIGDMGHVNWYWRINLKKLILGLI